MLTATAENRLPLVTATSNRTASVVYNAIVRSAWLCNYQLPASAWRFCWKLGCHMFAGPVQTRIHDYDVLVNYGHVYPVNARRFRTFNNPLIELVYQTYRSKHRKLGLVDIGANVGDTVLLVQRNCPDMLGNFVCIEGDPEFYSYLQNNVRNFENGKIILALLSATEGQERALVRTHPGTSSAQGNTLVRASTLDSLLLNDASDPVDLLKIDVDGFDGKVLQGATRILRTYRPNVIFEWHPIACAATGNNWTDHFDVLEGAGYRNFLWFTKYGNFSHRMDQADRTALEKLALECLSLKRDRDWHYDVVALSDEAGISSETLAELEFAQARISQF